nr:hypothetical protein CFP56_75356 [Quercus suber]
MTKHDAMSAKSCIVECEACCSLHPLLILKLDRPPKLTALYIAKAGGTIPGRIVQSGPRDIPCPDKQDIPANHRLGLSNLAVAHRRQPYSETCI